jgi:hypothetical protein
MLLRRIAAIALATGLCLAGSAQGEVSQEGNLITSFRGGLTPTRLPREKPAPVAVQVEGDFRTVHGAPLPQLRTISVAINGAGEIDDQGLPTCHPSRIQPATEEEAKKICGPAIVGTGHVTVQVHVENQPTFSVDADLLAFNGPSRHGDKFILAQVYAENPPGAFILTFRVHHGAGLFGTVMSTSLPVAARSWAYLSHFDMTLRRRYSSHGRGHSYVSAACSAPAGFPGAVFPFAKATYGFANGQRIKTTVVRSCRVRGH